MNTRFCYTVFFTILFSFISITASNNSEVKKTKGIDIEDIDRSVSPGDDFFQFAVGNWLKNNPIPDEYSRYGSFEVLQEENNNILKEILENSASNKIWIKGTASQKIGDFYSTGMDSIKIERDGYKPIISLLKQIDGINNKKDLVKFLGEFHLNGGSGLFGFFVSIDAKKSSIMIPYLSQGGIGLPDVEYYTKDDERSKEIRERYVQYAANMFKLINVDPSIADKYSQTIMNIETKLASASNTRLENRDPEKTYNKMMVRNLQSMSEDFNWDLYFQSLGVGKLDLVVVRQPKFFETVGKMMNEISLEDWIVYLKWNLIRGAAPALSSAFVNEHFEFNGRFLNGQQVMQPRWKRILAAVNSSMGELLGQLYVEKVFPPEAKSKAKSIVDNILVAMGESIKNLEWMSDDTKKQALKKLSTFGVKIGYPDKWKDYSGLEIVRDSYFKNLIRANIWARKENFAKIGKPVDPTEWAMNPQTVNAYYSPTRNEIVFPAAILQPPFFNLYADDAVNYGAMGVVIGHEITHGFDDQGRKYDAEGNIKEWWTEEDSRKFNERAQKLVGQFNSFVAVDTFRVDGKLTLGENIADLGGLTVSYAAFKNTGQYKAGEEIDGFTPQKRFFLSYAKVWANNIRDEALKLRLKTDVHSPGRFRVLGPLKNLPEFFRAFDVKPGDKMRLPDDEIVKIW